MLALRYAAVVAVAVWIGGLLTLGAIAAPTIFDVTAAHHLQDSRALAGSIFGEVLRRFDRLSYLCAAIVILSLVARAILGPRPRRWALRMLIVLLMLGATLYSSFSILPRAAQLRQQAGGTISNLPETDTRRVAFDRLHTTSTTLQLIPLAGGLVLMFWDLRD